MSKIAFVDICGTLFYSNTTIDFLSQRDPHFYALRKNLAMRVFNGVMRRAFKNDIVRKKGIAGLTGVSKSTLASEAGKWFDTFLKDRRIDESARIVNDLKANGYKIILISATMDFLAQEIAERVGADQIFSTTLSYANGVCQGKLENDMLGRKHLLATSLLQEEGQRAPHEIVVITDDKTDLDLARMAQQVYVVAPEKDHAFWKMNLGSMVKFIKK